MSIQFRKVNSEFLKNLANSASQAPKACLCKILLVRVLQVWRNIRYFVAIWSCLCTKTGGRPNKGKFTL